MTDADKTTTDATFKTVGEAMNADNNIVKDVGADVRERNRWGMVRQDTLAEWVETEKGKKVLNAWIARHVDPSADFVPTVMEASDSTVARAFFDAKPSAVVRRRWGTISEEQLVAELTKAGEEGPFVVLSNHLRRHFKASPTALCKVEDGRCAVFLGKTPDWYRPENRAPYEPPGDDPWQKNMFAVWLEDGEPTSEPEL
jgi:hypothetical protein